MILRGASPSLYISATLLNSSYVHLSVLLRHVKLGSSEGLRFIQWLQLFQDPSGHKRKLTTTLLFRLRFGQERSSIKYNLKDLCSGGTRRLTVLDLKWIFSLLCAHHQEQGPFGYHAKLVYCLPYCNPQGLQWPTWVVEGYNITIQSFISEDSRLSVL